LFGLPLPWCECFGVGDIVLAMFELSWPVDPEPVTAAAEPAMIATTAAEEIA
jgi:hypothetical protein